MVVFRHRLDQRQPIEESPRLRKPVKPIALQCGNKVHLPFDQPLGYSDLAFNVGD